MFLNQIDIQPFEINLNDFDVNCKEIDIKVNIEVQDIVDFGNLIFEQVYEECLELLYKEDYLKEWKECIKNNIEDTIDSIDIDTIYEFSLDEINEISDYVLDGLQTYIVTRSLYNKDINNKNLGLDFGNISMKLDKLNNINDTLPAQRTDKWYEMRHNMISASNLWKVFFSESSRRQIIDEKTKYLNTTRHHNGFDSTLEWGQRFEPVAQMYYQDMYKTNIKEYGCIPHSTYSFIGASPDGINIDNNSSLYGRLLEIKCIVNREITGIPKKEYWTQMQIQMECCDLDECDFLECRFKTYENEIEYLQDDKVNKSKVNQYKGIIISFFCNKESKFVYEYMPFHIESQTDMDKWMDTTMSAYDEFPSIQWMKNIYWYLEEVSCVYVPRNREWFNSILPKIEKCWKDIERNRLNSQNKHIITVTKTDTSNSNKTLKSVIPSGTIFHFMKNENEKKKLDTRISIQTNKVNKTNTTSTKNVVIVDTSDI